VTLQRVSAPPVCLLPSAVLGGLARQRHAGPVWRRKRRATGTPGFRKILLCRLPAWRRTPGKECRGMVEEFPLSCSCALSMPAVHRRLITRHDGHAARLWWRKIELPSSTIVLNMA
jgi:hypothetical protein